MFRNMLSSAVVLLATGGAFAADLPARVAAPAPYLAAPIFTWTGFYVGLNAGAAFNSNNNASVTTFGPLSPTFNPVYVSGNSGSDTNFTGGAQIGYNFQVGSFVFGGEADINYLHRNRGGSALFPAPINYSAGYDNQTDFALSNSGSANWFGTVRARVGYAFDRALIYATGGLAFGGKRGFNVNQRDSFETTELVNFGPSGQFVSNPIRQLPSSSDRQTVGWALGAGVEYALTNNWSVKAEYMHIDLGRSTDMASTLQSAPNTTVGALAGATMSAGNGLRVHTDNRFDIVRAGVNYRF
ncbi:MAG: porin family protein [Hyphomicrobiales bacterium]|nr:porin family protein [Hyphomicrobiales bacterium]